MWLTLISMESIPLVWCRFKYRNSHTQAMKNKEFIHHLPWSGRFSNSLEKQSSITYDGDLGRQAPSFWKSSLPSSSLTFICWEWCLLVWNISLVSWGKLPWLCVFPTSCVPPAWWGSVRSRKGFGCVLAISKTDKTSPYYQLSVQNKPKT